MAVNSFVENVNKLAISLYGDGTTPLDVSIITNNIEAITFLYNYISNGGEFGTIGASTVIENVSILPSVSTEGTIVYLNTNNKLYVYNGASWDEVGGSTGISVVGTLPTTADIGTVVYLATETALYVYNGTEWDKVGVSDNEAPTNTDWTLWSIIPNTSAYISAQGGQVTVTATSGVPTLSVSTGSYSGDTVTHATDVAYADLTKGTALGTSYISLKLYGMYMKFFGRKPELAGYVYWMKEAIANAWSEYELATAVYTAGRYAVVSTPTAVGTDWTTWTPLVGANTYMSAYGGQVTVVDNGTTTLPTITISAGAYTPSNPTQYAADTTYVTTQSRSFKSETGKYLANIIYGVYLNKLGKKPELAGYAYWMHEAKNKNWDEYTLANAIYTAAKANIVTSATNNDAVFVETKPTNPNIGDKVLNVLDGSVETWNGTTWTVQEYVPSVSSTTAIQMVDTLPASGNEGDIIYNTSNDTMYIYLNGNWSAYFETLVSTNGDTGIEVVVKKPLVVVDGKVIYDTETKKLYEGVNGLWVEVVQATSTATEVANASITVAKFAAGLRPLEIVDTLPTTNNTIGRMVYLTTDAQLYRYSASGWTNAVPAQALTGTITATQIADNAITTPKIATGAITADEIGANAITAGKIATGAVTAGTVAAGAITASEIASNAITSTKIYTGAITADKISANTITGDKIQAGAITATQIASNAIVAGHISAGVITADKIATGTITATQIASNAITAAKIAAGAITADKIDVYALTGKYANFDSSRLTTTTKGQAVVVANGGTVATVGMSGIGNIYGVVGECKDSSGQSVVGWGQTNDSVGVLGNSITKEGVRGDSISGTGVYGSSGSNKGVYGTTTSSINAAIHGTNNGTSNGVLGYSVGGWGVAGASGSSSYPYGLGTNQKCYAAQGYAPFTGTHICLMPKSKIASIGSLVAIKEAYVLSIDQCLIIVEPTTTANQKSVLGAISVISETIGKEILPEPIIKNFTQTEVTENGFTTTETQYTTVKEEFQAFVAICESGEYVQVEVNALGEGAMLVCSSGGNIEVGDYLVSSPIKGVAMKQADDILRASTVGKSMQGVDWSKETATTKLIAVTYHAG